MKLSNYKKTVLGLSLGLGISNLAEAAPITTLGDDISKKEPIYLNADTSEYFTKNQIVRASGNVVIIKGYNRLSADKITYFRNQKLIHAVGNIILTDKDGNTVKSDEIVLDESLERADINQFNGELADKSRIKAEKVKRLDANTFEMEQAAYTPCPICEGKKYPMWEIKADKVKLDNIKQEVYYDDVTLEMFGLPIFYSPYLFHPTPDADNKSGFLTPSFKSSPNFGNAFEVPYYISLTENQDITVSPMITTDEGLVMKGEYRFLNSYGKLNIGGSYTTSDQANLFKGDYNGESRGHIEGSGELNLSENWKFDFEGKHSSDDTYLRKFEISDEDVLSSRMTLSRITDRNYMNLQGLLFQGLNQNVLADNVPLILPHLEAHYETRKGAVPIFSGSKFYADLNGFSITRKDSGDDNRRINGKVGLEIPVIMLGSKLVLDNNIYASFYDGLNTTNKGQDGEVIYNVSADWSYPFINYIGNKEYVILEPQYNIYFSDAYDKSNILPNEDSQDLELSDVNIFSNSIFRGADLQESDLRMHYGLRLGYYNNDFKSSFLVGQKYKFDTDNSLSVFGLSEKQSNIVSRTDLNWGEKLKLYYSTEIDEESFKFQRNSFRANASFERASLNLDYNYISNIRALDNQNNIVNNVFANGNKLEEISASGSLNVYNEWSILGGARYDLSEGSEGFVSAFGGLNYSGECLQLTLTAKKEFISVDDIESGISYGFRVGLKNLGNLGN